MTPQRPRPLATQRLRSAGRWLALLLVPLLVVTLVSVNLPSGFAAAVVVGTVVVVIALRDRAAQEPHDDADEQW